MTSPYRSGTSRPSSQKKAGGGLIDSIYPVGSIYMSVNSTNPQTLFGGTWQRIQGRFLFAADSKHAAGSTGGEEKHKLTVEEMPRHTHKIDGSFNDGAGNVPVVNGFNLGTQATIEYTGGDQPHNNMPPYLAVYMWKRTA